MASIDFRRLAGLTDDYSSWRHQRNEDPNEISVSKQRIGRLARSLDEERYGAIRFDQFDPEVIARLTEEAALGDETAAHLVQHHQAAKQATVKAGQAQLAHQENPHSVEAATAAYHAHADAAQKHNSAALTHSRHGQQDIAGVHAKMAKNHEKWAEKAAMAMQKAHKKQAAQPSAGRSHGVEVHADPFPTTKTPAKPESPGDHAWAASRGAHGLHVNPEASHKTISKAHGAAKEKHLAALAHAVKSGDMEGASKHFQMVVHHAGREHWHRTAGMAQKHAAMPAGPRAATGRASR